MIISKKIITAMLGATSLLLTACITHPGPGERAPDDQLNAICQQLKQSIIMDANNTVPEGFGQNPAKQATMYKSYDEYHCDDVLTHVKNTSVSKPRT